MVFAHFNIVKLVSLLSLQLRALEQAVRLRGHSGFLHNDRHRGGPSRSKRTPLRLCGEHEKNGACGHVQQVRFQLSVSTVSIAPFRRYGVNSRLLCFHCRPTRVSRIRPASVAQFASLLPLISIVMALTVQLSIAAGAYYRDDNRRGRLFGRQQCHVALQRLVTRARKRCRRTQNKVRAKSFLLHAVLLSFSLRPVCALSLIAGQRTMVR